MKAYYRECLRNMMSYVKINKFADEFGIARSNLCMFLKGTEFDYCISEEKIRCFYEYCQDRISKL